MYSKEIIQAMSYLDYPPIIANPLNFGVPRRGRGRWFGLLMVERNRHPDFDVLFNTSGRTILDTTEVSAWPQADYFTKDQDQFWPWRIDEFESIVEDILQHRANGERYLPDKVKQVYDFGISAVVSRNRFAYCNEQHQKFLNKGHTVLQLKNGEYSIGSPSHIGAGRPYEIIAKLLRGLTKHEIPGIAEREIQDMILKPTFEDCFTFEEMDNSSYLERHKKVVAVGKSYAPFNGLCAVVVGSFADPISTFYANQRVRYETEYVWDNFLTAQTVYKPHIRWPALFLNCIVGISESNINFFMDLSAMEFEEGRGCKMGASTRGLLESHRGFLALGIGSWIDLEDTESLQNLEVQTQESDSEESIEYVSILNELFA